MNFPWCTLGDLSATIGPTMVLWPNKCVALISDIEAVDHPAIDSFFTQSNKCEENLQFRGLDRVMVNEYWINKPCFSKVHFIELDILNHSPSIISIVNLGNAGPKPFKYFSHWGSYCNVLMFCFWSKGNGVHNLHSSNGCPISHIEASKEGILSTFSQLDKCYFDHEKACNRSFMICRRLLYQELCMTRC